MSDSKGRPRANRSEIEPPNRIVEVVLKPGDFYFGDRNTRIRTLLGSCVSMTVWHPALRVGGMCHYMLPYRPLSEAGAVPHVLSGRYGEEAMQMFCREMARYDPDPRHYVVKAFGGGDMFPGYEKRGACHMDSERSEIQACQDVPCKNSAAIHSLARQYGFVIAAEHLRGSGHRNVIFEIWSGQVWLRQVPVAARPR